MEIERVPPGAVGGCPERPDVSKRWERLTESPIPTRAFRRVEGVKQLVDVMRDRTPHALSGAAAHDRLLSRSV